ncbi:MAG: extracellular solute-binding protein [Anaerolineae bacterium]|jgi:multiple sugar transport system substrate-binding protein/sn-glycerol 3-phosphate transport system substrate-binding protein|nr:extracellular solute-binding protein [Anaerolineae bacterium]
MKNVFAFLVLLLVIGSAISAQEAADLSAIDPSGQTIVYWHEWDGAQLEALDQIIANFNANNEWGITVETVAQGNTGNMGEAMNAAITSGDLPNLVGGFSSTAQDYYLDGVLVPLDAYVTDATWGFTEEQAADINFELIDGFNRISGEPFNGQLLAWPMGLSSVVMSVNLEMLNELGFETAPETLEQFREVACAANELTTEAGGDVQGFPLRANGQDMEAFILNQGGSIFDPETNTFSFTNETTIEVLTFFQQLYNDGCAYIPETNFQNTADFAFGLNPMAVGSSVGVPFILNDIEESGSGIVDWTNTTPPWSEGNRTLVLNFRSVLMIQSTPEQQLATWLFMKHLASQESQLIWTELTRYFPYTNSALEGLGEEFITANPQFASVRDVLLDDSVRKYGASQILGYQQAIAEFSNLVADITTGGRDVAEAAAEREALANEILAERQAEIQP